MLRFDTDTGRLSRDRNGAAAGGRLDLMMLQGVSAPTTDDVIPSA